MYFAVVFAIGLVAFVSGADVPPPPPADSKNACPRRNDYIKVDGQCDAYVECKDYVAVQKLCPDGLHYNPAVAWPSYPCGYPSDVHCQAHSAIQPAQADADCPHLFGYFPSPLAAPNDCGQYRMCVMGKPFEMLCPTGLAFNFATGRCDWPELVPTCNSEKFLGFQCPAPTYDQSGNPIKTNHRYEGNCYAFFSCESGKPHLLSCDSGFAFDAVSGQCIDADKVSCPQNSNAQQTPQSAA